MNRLVRSFDYLFQEDDMHKVKLNFGKIYTDFGKYKDELTRMLTNESADTSIMQ